MNSSVPALVSFSPTVLKWVFSWLVDLLNLGITPHRVGLKNCVPVSMFMCVYLVVFVGENTSPEPLLTRDVLIMLVEKNLYVFITWRNRSESAVSE